MLPKQLRVRVVMIACYAREDVMPLGYEGEGHYRGGMCEHVWAGSRQQAAGSRQKATSGPIHHQA